MNSSSKVWLITGVSGGLGRALAKEAAEAGDIVIGTLRKPDQAEQFENLVPGKTFAIQLDVNHHNQIPDTIETITAKFGRIDILVNNAGYGLFGAIEEVSMEEARKQMETNFFSALALTQAALPVMRQQKGGHIVQISSMAGIKSNPGMGLYNASKFAMEGFSEALFYEGAPLNIKVTIVEPGPFFTDWAGTSSARAEKVIEDYADTAGTRIETVQGYSGNQPGDPAKAAKVIIAAVNSENPPLRLPLGKTALGAVKEKLNMVEQDCKQWEEQSLNTDF
ncbi:oxidoreductase [Rubrolithibacter danxiaensis]|uniref:oxidoreductase n=1 Tax=Rubrolithibacter danxiaensis TaxID=3390805 RepID=UPI003BF80DC2